MGMELKPREVRVRFAALLLILLLILSGCGNTAISQEGSEHSAGAKLQMAETLPYASQTIEVSEVPDYEGSAYIAVNGNVPYFTDEDKTTQSFENYAELDEQGRCGVAYANVGQDLLPTEERGAIGAVKPTGWHTIKYDNVDGKYLYNRCHLIGYQLTGENANEKNLLTGTRYLNIEGMLPFEDLVAEYVESTANHVLYRVTPVYEGDNLLAKGVLMEGYSVEDEGTGINYCIFAYNVQPGIVIDYATGDSYAYPNAGTNADTNTQTVSGTSSDDATDTYVLNTNTNKFHLPQCSSVTKKKDHNKETFQGDRQELINQGYEPCQNCNP